MSSIEVRKEGEKVITSSTLDLKQAKENARWIERAISQKVAELKDTNEGIKEIRVDKKLKDFADMMEKYVKYREIQKIGEDKWKDFREQMGYKVKSIELDLESLKDDLKKWNLVIAQFPPEVIPPPQIEPVKVEPVNPQVTPDPQTINKATTSE